MTDVWEDSWDQRLELPMLRRRDRMVDEPEFAVDDEVMWTTGAFGQVPGKIISVYDPEEDGRTTVYQMLAEASKCPKEYKDRVIPIVGGANLSKLKKAPGPPKKDIGKKAPAKKATAKKAVSSSTPASTDIQFSNSTTD